MDLSSETEATLDMYGPDVRKPGTFARNCLIARRLAEQVSRHAVVSRGWDQHGDCRGTFADRLAASTSGCGPGQGPEAARLAQRHAGHLGGEFGRTIYSQGDLKPDNYGAIITGAASRCGWPARRQTGRRIRRTDEYSYNIVENPVHIATSTPPCCTAWHRTLEIQFPPPGSRPALTGVEPCRW